MSANPQTSPNIPPEVPVPPEQPPLPVPTEPLPGPAPTKPTPVPGPPEPMPPNTPEPNQPPQPIGIKSLQQILQTVTNVAKGGWEQRRELSDAEIDPGCYWP
jgi:hypothetical protein